MDECIPIGLIPGMRTAEEILNQLVCNQCFLMDECIPIDLIPGMCTAEEILDQLVCNQLEKEDQENPSSWYICFTICSQPFGIKA